MYDITVIGSGPGGYVAAIRAAQLGFKTAIIEKYSVLGGTCLNVGCIPSKALLDSSEIYHNAVSSFEKHGISATNINIDLTKMILRKNEVVKQLNSGISYLMKKHKIDVIEGEGSFLSKNKIKIVSNGNEKLIETNKTIIATGSKPAIIKGIEIDKKRIITSTEALSLSEIPKHLIVIGGGAIGLELGSVYKRLGSKVSVVEFMDTIIPAMDGSLSKELARVLKKQGFEFYLKHKVKSVKNTGKSVVLTAENAKGETINIEGDYCLVSVGRIPYTNNLALENTGVKLDEKGRVMVDENLQTNVDGIYAIGDVIRGAMLAHKAEEEGVFVVERIAGQKPHINYNLIPSVVYTWPEVAAVGKTEEQLKSENIGYKTGTCSYKSNGRAIASTDTDGFVKIIANTKTDEILGVHIIGPRAADIIGEAVLAMEYRASAEDIARTSHAHPTYSEALKEAALDTFEKRPIHY
ncbi:MAG: dihydrolipoyl dehydrogenase [Bacteroidetes bacterium]|nr:dihydrolipoyl dehydrogenase [Bacteroidota bacterium]